MIMRRTEGLIGTFAGILRTWRISGRLRASSCAVLSACVLFVWQGEAAHAGYVTAHPAKDVYRVYVMGDSIGVGLDFGLKARLRRTRQFKVVKLARRSTGLVRRDKLDWIAAARRIAARRSADIVVMLVGANDMQGIRGKGGYHNYPSESWKVAYGDRMEEIVRTLRAANVAVYWVEMPPMRRKRLNKHVKIVNSVFSARAAALGVRYVRTWPVFSDSGGRFVRRGADDRGRVRTLRAGDGVHFTPAGYRRLASLADKMIVADISAARGTPFVLKMPDKKKAKRRLARRTSVPLPVRNPLTSTARAVRTAAVGPDLSAPSAPHVTLDAPIAAKPAASAGGPATSGDTKPAARSAGTVGKSASLEKGKSVASDPVTGAGDATTLEKADDPVGGAMPGKSKAGGEDKSKPEATSKRAAKSARKDRAKSEKTRTRKRRTRRILSARAGGALSWRFVGNDR